MSTHAVSTHPVLACAQTMEKHLASVAEARVWAMSPDDKQTALTTLARVEAQVAELKLRVLAGASDLAEQTAARHPGAWLAHATKIDPQKGHADWFLARKLEERYLRTAAAMRTGSVSLAHARVIVTALDALPAELDQLAIARAEKHLIELAGQFEPQILRKLGKKILEVAAPDKAEEIEARALEREEQRANEKCSIRFRPQGNGTTRITGLLPDLFATRLQNYLDALTSPRNPNGPAAGAGSAGGTGQDAGPFGRPDPTGRPGPRATGTAEDTDPSGRSGTTGRGTATDHTHDNAHDNDESDGSGTWPTGAVGSTAATGTAPDADETAPTGWAIPGTSSSGNSGSAGTDPSTGTSTGGAGCAGFGPRHRRLGQALCMLLEHLNPERLPDHGGDATVVTVTIDYDRLVFELGTALVDGSIDGDLSISAAQARRLACTAKIIPAVLGGDSAVLDLGRAKRLYSPAQRRAMRLRDRHCRAEGCTIPARWCESHHVKPWSLGGDTNLADGVLFCSHHHHTAHDTRYEMTKLPSGDYRFHRRT